MSVSAGLALLLVTSGQFLLVSTDAWLLDAQRRLSATDGDGAAAQYVKRWMEETRRRGASVESLLLLGRNTRTPTLSASYDRTLLENHCVKGVAIRDNELYVAHDRNPFIVEVYDATTYTLLRRVDIPGLQCVNDLASCHDCDAVYLVSDCTETIYVIDGGDTGGGLRTQWTVDEEPWSVSVSGSQTLLVSFYMTSKIREYTPSGQLIRELPMPADVLNPMHAIRLDSGQLAVPHGHYLDGSVQRVCIIDDNNGDGVTPHRCYGGIKGTGLGQLKTPYRMVAVGDVLIVTETNSNQLVMFDISASSLTYLGVLIDTKEEGLFPSSMALSHDGTRLFVTYDVTRGNGCPIKVYSLSTA